MGDIMRRAVKAIGPAATLLLLGACSTFGGQSTVSSDWQCRAIGEGSCTSIRENDRRALGYVEGMSARQPIMGPASQSVRYDASTAGSEKPVFYGRTILRVTIAPWVDEAGHFHSGSVVFTAAGAEAWGPPRQSIPDSVPVSQETDASEPAAITEAALSKSYAPAEAY